MRKYIDVHKLNIFFLKSIGKLHILISVFITYCYFAIHTRTLTLITGYVYNNCIFDSVCTEQISIIHKTQRALVYNKHEKSTDTYNDFIVRI